MAGHVRIGVSQHLGHIVERRPACQNECSERMTSRVRRKAFANTAYIGQLFQIGVHLLIAAYGKQYTVQ